MRRALLASVILLFLALSGATARVLSGNGAEREGVIERIRAAAGGEITILRLDPSGRFPVATRRGHARVAWRRAGDRLPTVQCVPVVRAGLLEGSTVSVGRPGRPIDPEGSCPR